MLVAASIAPLMGGVNLGLGAQVGVVAETLIRVALPWYNGCAWTDKPLAKGRGS